MLTSRRQLAFMNNGQMLVCAEVDRSSNVGCNARPPHPAVSGLYLVANHHGSSHHIGCVWQIIRDLPAPLCPVLGVVKFRASEGGDPLVEGGLPLGERPGESDPSRLQRVGAWSRA